jgi:uncharacterized membrane protein
MDIHHLAYLRAIHILGASFWVGGAVLNAVFLIPSVMAVGPAGGQVMREMAQVRRLPVFMNTVMGVTLLSGLWLYWLDSSGFRPAWIASGPGIAFTFGALCAFATWAIGLIFIVPAVKRVGQLGAAIAAGGGPPRPEQVAEMQALQRRMLRGSRIGATLVVTATIAMAMARFL